jgi:predicted AAA+ superfamily ATPase
MVEGPRGCGKTTLAERAAASVVRLDDQAQAAAFQLDPAAALNRLPEPILIDEWQQVPAVLGAVKRAVDTDPHPGRFILTGSVTAKLREETWPGTGRLVQLGLQPLAAGEILKATGTPTFLERLRDPDPTGLMADGATDLAGYVGLATRGGFPGAVLAPSDTLALAWLESYASELATRDALKTGQARDPEKLTEYMEVYALNAAGTAQDVTLERAAHLSHTTAAGYEQLLKNLFVAISLPAWASNELTGLGKSPKRFITDSGLWAALAGCDADAAFASGDLMGRLIETFAFCQIRAGLQTYVAGAPKLFHARESHGRYEVDLVVRYRDRRVAAVEVKATAAPTAHDARHLEKMRDALGDQFIRGVLLHTGPRAFEVSDRIIAAPISTIWTAPQPQ